MLKVIEDEITWRQIIQGFSLYDFYHTWDYHKISKKEGETPLLIYFEQGNTAIALPFLKRRIAQTGYFDLTSVYGYAGPLSRNLDAHFDNSTFREALLELLEACKIISVFSRLNPFISFQDTVLDRIGEIHHLGPIVNIDLTKNEEDQWLAYSKTTKRYVNRLRRLCHVVSVSSGGEVSRFIDLYYETMKRVEAEPDYFFEEAYFFGLMESREFQCDLMIAKLRDTDEIISGALMIKTRDIVQYHLSGTRSEYLNLTPLRLLIDETRIRAMEEGYRFFNLGGGLGSQEDSLFYFKSSFSKDFRSFSVWKYIVNEAVYLDLCEQRKSEIEDPAHFEESGYFPLYRFKS
ncbi:GNAT family N-acetyltransferase [Robiginitalea marina]|uniref:GNAT family N-acetyltransferase n=1 Tax=Robiginitalea marina TaxID=2954105 RepID=A0ABT1AVE4_9FLAO|nr:GNAT family N-acetyltransferase [Robiginitalea marina]MCO5723323.1 GNAT family N-acetyltransferase [Robiginitalea marina]